MFKPVLSVLNWNTAWKRRNTIGGEQILSLLREADTDIACLTEATIGLQPPDHHSVFSGANYGYRMVEGRRKVILSSRTPWNEVQNNLPGAPSGRFVAGTTSTPLGDIRVIGVCVPWEQAHVATGQRNRRRWEDHTIYLTSLLELDDVSHPRLPTIIIGDFNQTLPSKRAPVKARAMMEVLTQLYSPLSEQAQTSKSVCHILATQAFECLDLSTLPKTHNGISLSDHQGQLAIVSFNGPSPRF